MGATITAIQVQKKNRQRVNVHLDGEFAFGLTIQTALGLRLGQVLSDEEIAALRAEDAYQMGMDVALRFLGSRPRSCWEVEQRLARRGVDEAVTERVVRRLQEIGLLDDLAFAKHWIENRETFRPRSRRLLQQELRRKGVPTQVIAEAMEMCPVDDYESARLLAATRVHRYQGLSRAEVNRKLGGLLARRGFSWDVVQRVMDEIWDGELAGAEVEARASAIEEE
jgi:regulatory protein